MGIPTPTHCPDERLRRRLAWRHGGRLFEITCASTGKKTFSMYGPECGFPLYEGVLVGGHWDGCEYGREFNFSRPFFEQFAELAVVVPRISLVNTNSKNSYYTSHGLNLKNCYGIVGGADSEDCLHSFFIQKCRDLVDTTSLVDCELCIAGHSSIGCYSCVYVAHCRNCSDSLLIRDCTSCKDCIGCVGLQQK